MRSGARSFGAGGARGVAGVRNSIADGRWHSFGVGRSGFAGSGFGRGIGGNGFAGRGFGRGFGGRGFGFRGRGFGGCWGCGFGLGFGWGGWGWPYWGFDWGWPYWDLGYGWGYPGWGYAYPYWDGYWGPDAYPPDYGYDDGAYDNNPGDYSGYNGDMNDYSGNYSDNSVYSNAPDDSAQAPEGAGVTQPNSSNLASGVDPESIPTVVYLKDGTSFQITSYWSSGNTLHYVDSQGAVSTIDASQIDLQRTASENAKHGIRFPIKPQPSTATPSAPVVPSAAPTVQTTSLSKAA